MRYGSGKVGTRLGLKNTTSVEDGPICRKRPDGHLSLTGCLWSFSIAHLISNQQVRRSALARAVGGNTAPSTLLVAKRLDWIERGGPIIYTL